MKELLLLLRSMQLYAHSAHNLISGPNFFADHSFFGDTYSSLEGDYDDVAERIIGLFGKEHMNLNEIIANVHTRLANCPSNQAPDANTFFQYQLKLELELIQSIETLSRVDGVSQGVIQLIGEIANKSESRCYKLKQRLAQ